MDAFCILNGPKYGDPYGFQCLLGDQLISKDLYALNTGLTIYEVRQNIQFVKEFLHKLSVSGHRIFLSDFGRYLRLFKDFDANVDVIFDCCIPTESTDYLKRFINALSSHTWMLWNTKCSIVLYALENRGIKIGYDIQKPQWSNMTYTGRTTSKKYNIQGYDCSYPVMLPISSNDWIFLQFDWASADVRIAAALSGDEQLLDDYRNHDIYNLVADGGDRSDAKLRFLSAINRIDYTERLFDKYSKLREWLKHNHDEICNGRPVYSILGRPFMIRDQNKPTAPFNASMQGSIAHAMHSCLWDAYVRHSSYLVCDLHDGLVFQCPRDSAKSLAKSVISYMTTPPALGIDFKVTVSVVTKWRDTNG